MGQAGFLSSGKLHVPVLQPIFLLLWTITTLTLLNLALGCYSEIASDETIVSFESVSTKSPLQIKLSYQAGDDSTFGGDNAKSFGLQITNLSSEQLDGCTLIFDGQYATQLKDLEYYYGIFTGNNPYGINVIAPRETVEFSFSHDNNNYSKARNGKNEILPNTKLLGRITLKCHQGILDWVLKEV
jgi:hypothetical protein